MRWRLDRRAGTPARENSRSDVDEQPGRQVQCPDRPQLPDLSHHRLQAHVARTRLDQGEQGGGPFADVVRLVTLTGGDQGKQTAHHRRIQPAGDPGRPVLFGGAHSRTDHPQHPAGGGRLDAFLPKLGQQPFPYPVSSPLGLRNRLRQPCRQPLLILERGHTEAQMIPNLGTVILDRAP